MQLSSIDRIRKYIRDSKMPISHFEKALGKSNGYVMNVKSFPSDVMDAIFEIIPDLSAEWVFRGEGCSENSKNAISMKKEIEREKAMSESVSEAYRERINELQKEVVELRAKLKFMNSYMDFDDIK